MSSSARPRNRRRHFFKASALNQFSQEARPAENLYTFGREKMRGEEIEVDDDDIENRQEDVQPQPEANDVAAPLTIEGVDDARLYSKDDRAQGQPSDSGRFPAAIHLQIQVRTKQGPIAMVTATTRLTTPEPSQTRMMTGRVLLSGNGCPRLTMAL
jgi:hypothetical protein